MEAFSDMVGVFLSMESFLEDIDMFIFSGLGFFFLSYSSKTPQNF